MNFWSIAIVMGIVEGLTEFLPVSSTGHLIIAGHLLGFVGDKASSFEVAIQLGAILSVVFLYWRRFLGLIPTHSSSTANLRSTLEGWSGLWRIAVATFPALLVGYLARHAIKERLFNPEAVTVALAVGGVALLLVERLVSPRRSGSLDTLTSTQAFGIGLFQILALWPGTSRAAATIVGGMLLGLDRKAAAEFSFLIAVPVLFAATGLLVQFGLQAFINMGSTVSLMPTKGMTLPFISYGGSSLIAIAFGMGMTLALTRRRPGQETL